MKTFKAMVILVLAGISSAAIAAAGIEQPTLNNSPAGITVSPLTPPLTLPIPGYLIIYAHDFRPEVCPELDSFIQWKLRKGLNVYTMDLNDMGIRGDTGDVYHVKSYIESWYNSSHCNPDAPANYVLLVGDAPLCNLGEELPGDEDYGACQAADDSHIPIYTGWSAWDWKANPPTYEGHIFSDYFYQLIEGGDLIPDVCLGRWCPQDGVDLETYVNKTFAYEKTPDMAWKCNGLLFVSKDYIDSKQAVEATLPDQMRENLETLYGSDARMDNVQAAIEQDSGVGIVNYRGHGSSYMWVGVDLYTEDPPGGLVWPYPTLRDYSNQPCFPIVFNVCCSNGAITNCWESNPYAPELGNKYPNEVEVIVEAWTRNDSGGAAAALGATRASWPDENDFFDKMIFTRLYDADFPYNCGRAINDAKKYTLLNAELDPDKAEENAKSYLWIGDPELDVWRSQPLQAELLCSVNLQQQLIEVKVQEFSPPHTPYPGTKVCLYREGGGHHRLTTTNEFGVAYFSIPSLPGDYTITATNQWSYANCIIPVSTTYSNGSLFSSGTGEAPPTLASWQLKPVFPNPMHSQTTISYSVGGAGASQVNLAIFDASGRMVQTLVSSQTAPGNYHVTWDGCDAAGTRCPAGVYFVKMSSTSFNANERLVLIR